MGDRKMKDRPSRQRGFLSCSCPSYSCPPGPSTEDRTSRTEPRSQRPTRSTLSHGAGECRAMECSIAAIPLPTIPLLPVWIILFRSAWFPLRPSLRRARAAPVRLARIGQAAQPAEDTKWLPLGVFALVEGDETNSDDIFQLAVDRQQGIIRGNYHNVRANQVEPHVRCGGQGDSAYGLNHRQRPDPCVRGRARQPDQGPDADPSPHRGRPDATGLADPAPAAIILRQAGASNPRSVRITLRPSRHCGVHRHRETARGVREKENTPQ